MTERRRPAYPEEMRWRVLLILSSFALEGPAVAAGFSPERIERLAATEPAALFRDGRFRCVLRALLGPSGATDLEGVMTEMEADRKPDRSGVYRFAGAVPGMRSLAEGLVLVHPDGRLWVGMRKDGKLLYATNAPGDAEDPPGPWRRWARPGLAWTVASPAPDAYRQAAAECPPETADACDRAAPFVDTAVVDGAGTEKVFGRDAKGVAMPGDLVRRTLGERDGFVCAVLREQGGSERVLELPASRLVPFDGKAREARRGARPPPEPWKGVWRREDGTMLVITGATRGPLRVDGQVTVGPRSRRIRSRSFAVVGAVATVGAAAPDANDACVELELYRFRNALAVDETNACGDAGLTFAGTYYREP